MVSTYIDTHTHTPNGNWNYLWVMELLMTFSIFMLFCIFQISYDEHTHNRKIKTKTSSQPSEAGVMEAFVGPE